MLIGTQRANGMKRFEINKECFDSIRYFRLGNY